MQPAEKKLTESITIIVTMTVRHREKHCREDKPGDYRVLEIGKYRCHLGPLHKRHQKVWVLSNYYIALIYIR